MYKIHPQKMKLTLRKLSKPLTVMIFNFLLKKRLFMRQGKSSTFEQTTNHFFELPLRDPASRRKDQVRPQ